MLKTIPFTMAHTYIAHIWLSSPPNSPGWWILAIVGIGGHTNNTMHVYFTGTKNRISFITLISLSQLQTGTAIILRLANFWQSHCRLVTVPSPMRNVDHTTRSTSTLFKFFSFLHTSFQLIRKDEG